MHGSTLLLTLRLLNDEERQFLDYFIASPMFKLTNRHQDAVALLRYLKPFAPAYEPAEALARAQAAQQLFGHRAKPEAELRKAMSNLNAIIRKLLLLQQLNATGADGTPAAQLLTARTELALLHFYSERLHARASADKKKNAPLSSGSKSRQAEGLVEQTYHSLLAKVQQIEAQTLQLYSARQYLELLQIRLDAALEWYNYNLLNGAPNAQYLLQALTELEQQVHYQRFDLQLSLQAKLLTGNAFQSPAEVQFARDYLHAAAATQPHSPMLGELGQVLELYRQALVMLQELEAPAGFAAFEYLETELQKGNIQLPREQIQGLKAVLRLYCGIVGNRTKNNYFQQKRFELFREHIKEEMLLRQGHLPAIQLCSLISDALRLGAENHAWAEAFLQQFDHGINIIGSETPREVYKVNKANLLFHQASFKQAANELVGYEWYGRIDEPQILLLAIRVDLKTRYELRLYDDEHTLRTLDAAEKRILRLESVEPQLAQMTLTFLRVIKQLLGIQQRLSQPPTGSSRRFDPVAKCQQLRTMVLDKPIAEKNWLLEKIEGVG